MPTISQLPLATDFAADDTLPISQNGVARSLPIGTLLAATQPELTLARGTLLGRVSNGPGEPESVALGTGLQILDDVLLVDHRDFPQTGTLAVNSQVILNDSSGAPALMPISLLRGLYQAGQNVTIDPDGTIHSTPAVATSGAIGSVAIGNGLVINASGQLSVNVGAVPGTIAAGDDPRIVNAQSTTQKNLPGGYAGLDGGGKLPAALLPGGGSGSLSGADASAAVATAAFPAAVSRTIAAYLSDVISINDFGLARDGVTDDSLKFVLACQTAMAGNRKLYIPSGGPILLTDAAQQKLSNICIYGDGIRDYDGPQGYGHAGSVLWFNGTARSPFLLGAAVQFQGITFFWPNQTEVATASNGNLPIAYPPLFAQQSPAVNITYFQFSDCQVTNCYDFFNAVGTSAVVGACTVERCIIYAIRNCFTLQFVPEVFFIANTLFTFGVYGSVVSVGPTFNLRNYTSSNGTWLKVVGDGSATSISTTTVGGIMSSNNYVFGVARGIWLAAGTLDISAFVNTGFDNVPTVLQGDPGCAMFSTRFTGGAWYPLYFSQAGNPQANAIVINNPAPGDVGLNCTFAGITIPFINGSFGSITGTNISSISFSDIRCPNLGHTAGGTGPYFGLQFNAPNAVLRVTGCDFAASFGGLSNTGVQIIACASATISGCTFRNFSSPIDIETTSGQVTLSGNTTIATQGATPVIGTATGNLHDLFNNWDKPNFSYNGFAPNLYRGGATIGIQPVASTATTGYIGLQPSGTGSGGGTRFGITAAGSSPVSLLTNTFGEEQLRVNRQVGAVNYVAMRGSLSGAPTLVSTNGADGNGSIQLTGQGGGVTYLGLAGATGSAVAHLGATADQSYIGSAPASGFTLAVPANCSTVLLKPAATLLSGSISLPAALLDGEKIEIWSSKTINALTVTGQPGTIVNNGSQFPLSANSSVAFFWNAANGTWFQRLGGSGANGSIAQQDANNVAITGGSITGLTALGVGSNAAVSASMVLNTAPGFARQVVYESSGLPRWVAGAQGNAENTVATTTSADALTGATGLLLASTAGITSGMLLSATGVASGTTVASVSGGSITLSQPTTGPTSSGSALTAYTNAGSDYAILPFDDLGNPLAGTLGQSLLINRATGMVSIKTLAVIGSAAAPTPANGDASTAVATTAFVANALVARIGAAGGIAGLDGGGRVPASQLPASLQGALNYQGGWNAATNTPPLVSATGTKGFYYTVAATGATALDGISQWNVGDHAAFNGSAWEKFDGVASEVTSVAGRTGAVTLATSDIGGIAAYAPLSSAAFTGTPTAPTAAALANSTQLATTAYADAAVAVEAAARAVAIGGLGTMATQNKTAVSITGGTIAGLTGFAIGSNAGPAITPTINAAAGGARQVVYQSAGVSRWNLMVQGDAESAAVNTTAAAASTASTTLQVASVTGIVVGMSVGASGVNAGTLVTAISSPNVTLSVAATVANGAAVSFYPNAGSSFTLRAYDDGGNLLFAPLSSGRGSGATLTVGTQNYGPVAVFGGSAFAGNTRGVGAFDAQQIRTSNTQIASGAYAALFGSSNIASGQSSFAAGQFNVASGLGTFAGGNGNNLTASYSAAPGGNSASDRGRYASFAWASGQSAVLGDTQTAWGVLRGASTTSAGVRMTADGNAASGTNTWNLPAAAAGVFRVRLELVGWIAASGLAVAYTATFRLKKTGSAASTTVISNTTLAADADNDTISGLTAPTIAADTTLGALALTSGFATSAAMRWAARVISAVELQ